MKYLFIDNFRGFRKAIIPIRNVNFLVGQNSTGKTSLLGLLKVLSSSRFLFEHDFGDKDVSFGNFFDMVSAHSRDQHHFHIGLAWQKESKKAEDRKPVGWLLSYAENEGIPRLARFTFCRGSEKMSVRFHGKNVFVKREKLRTTESVHKIVAALPKWAIDHCADDMHGYEKLDIPPTPARTVPLLVAWSISLQEDTEKKRKRSVEITLQSPEDILFTENLAWIAPIRSKPKPTYGELPLDFSPEGEHTPYLIRRLLRSKKNASRFHASMKKFGKASGLFQDVTIKHFGQGPGNPFEVDIVLDSKAFKLTTVGYGVSQSLPVIVELLARLDESWFAIQQPEVHLHPRAQAALGDLIFEMAARDHKHFLIETHSDFMIDRFRMNYRKTTSSQFDSQILFFNRHEGVNIVTPLAIGSKGDLPVDQPALYREFFIREQMDLLGL